MDVRIWHGRPGKGEYQVFPVFKTTKEKLAARESKRARLLEWARGREPVQPGDVVTDEHIGEMMGLAHCIHALLDPEYEGGVWWVDRNEEER